MREADLNGVIDVCGDQGRTIVATGAGATIDFELDRPVRDVEVRLMVPGGFSATMERLTIEVLN